MDMGLTPLQMEMYTLVVGLKIRCVEVVSVALASYLLIDWSCYDTEQVR